MAASSESGGAFERREADVIHFQDRPYDDGPARNEGRWGARRDPPAQADFVDAPAVMGRGALGLAVEPKADSEIAVAGGRRDSFSASGLYGLVGIITDPVRDVAASVQVARLRLWSSRLFEL